MDVLCIVRTSLNFNSNLSFSHVSGSTGCSFVKLVALSTEESSVSASKAEHSLSSFSKRQAYRFLLSGQKLKLHFCQCPHFLFYLFFSPQQETSERSKRTQIPHCRQMNVECAQTYCTKNIKIKTSISISQTDALCRILGATSASQANKSRKRPGWMDNPLQG